MGSSFWSRCLVTLVFLLLSVLYWESLMSWRRYELESANLGGFRLEGEYVLPLEPGETKAPTRLISAEEFRGARYVVLTPLFPFDSLLGKQSRCRLIGLFQKPEEPEGTLGLIPWGGGIDPLAEFLRMTRLLTENLIPRIRVRIYDFHFSARELGTPQALRFEGRDLVLAPAS